MKNNLDQFARLVQADNTAIITPEAIPAILENGTFSSSDWQKTRQGELDRPAGDFFKGDFPAVRADLQAGTLITPPPEVDEIAASLAATLTATANTARRRRRFDGDEGEINVARYIDDRDERLFRRRRRTLTQAPTVNIIGSFCFSGSQSIKRFFEAAAALCATVQALESAGYSANVYAQQHTHTNNDAGLLLQIKTAGTPLNISQIWTYTRPEVSRRIYFALLCQIADFNGLRHHPGIGYPHTPGDFSKITGDPINIFIDPDMIKSTKDDPAALASSLQRLIDEATTTTPQED